MFGYWLVWALMLGLKAMILFRNGNSIWLDVEFQGKLAQNVIHTNGLCYISTQKPIA